jgi:hypothetical protein
LRAPYFYPTPWAMEPMSVATATAAPPLDPPQFRARSHGLRVAQSWVALVGTLDFCESADMQDFPGMHGSNIVLRQS